MAADFPAPGRLAVFGAGAMLALCLGAVVLVLIGWRPGTPRDDSPEAGFARDMATHHAQAVEMSLLVRDQSSDDHLRTLAYDIIVTQATQRGVFMGWLEEWGLPQASSRPRMAWMPGHPQSTGSGGATLMHGMASEEELQRLRTAKGIDAEILFLQLMIRHHEGGITMARAILPLSDRAEVVRMAKSIESGQRAEIEDMQRMLASRGARPLSPR
jgi:uncharacterized protein (DUF305 family)